MYVISSVSWEKRDASAAFFDRKQLRFHDKLVDRGGGVAARGDPGGGVDDALKFIFEGW